MNNEKAIWAGKAGELLYNNIRVSSFENLDDTKVIAIRLNATEGLNIEALKKHPGAISELIEAAKEALEALKIAGVRMKMETPATGMLQSALTNLFEVNA